LFLNRSRKFRIFVGIVAGAIYGLVLRLSSETSIFSGFYGLMGAYVMSFTFIIIVPFVIGYIVVYFSKFDGKSSMKFQIITPWLSIYILLAFTYLLYLEGLICIIMAAPVFMVLSSLGGLLGGEFANDKKRLNIIFINIIIILPFFSIAVENKIEKPIELMQVDTQIEIKSDPGTVWKT